MNDLHKLLRKVEAYASDAGISPDAVCRAATKNPRLYDRLKRRAAQTDADVLRLEKYMRKNPTGENDSADRHIQHGAGSAVSQGGAPQ